MHFGTAPAARKARCSKTSVSRTRNCSFPLPHSYIHISCKLRELEKCIVGFYEPAQNMCLQCSSVSLEIGVPKTPTRDHMTKKNTATSGSQHRLHELATHRLSTLHKPSSPHMRRHTNVTKAKHKRHICSSVDLKPTCKITTFCHNFSKATQNYGNDEGRLQCCTCGWWYSWQ